MQEATEKESLAASNPQAQPTAAADSTLMARAAKLKALSLLLLVSATLLLLLLLTVQSQRQQHTTVQLTRHEQQNTQAILTRLGDINTQLQQLATNAPHSSPFKTAVATIQDDLVLIKQLALAEQNNLHGMTQQLAALRTAMDSQLQDIRTAVVNGEAKHYLAPTVLPFQVLAVDVLAQQPWVSVQYDHHVTALTLGDTLAGWQLTAADYSTGTAEFKNAKDQYVKVALPG